MTGEKNRGTTHEKLWDLDDKQLKTPKHDEMVLWLLDKENLEKLDLIPQIKREIRWENFNTGKKVHIEDLPEDIKRIHDNIHFDMEIKSEVPITGNNRFIIGYADLILSYAINL